MIKWNREINHIRWRLTDIQCLFHVNLVAKVQIISSDDEIPSTWVSTSTYYASVKCKYLCPATHERLSVSKVSFQVKILQVCFASRWQPCLCSRAVVRPEGGSGSLQQTESTAKPLSHETTARQTNTLKLFNPFLHVLLHLSPLSSRSSWPSSVSSVPPPPPPLFSFPLASYMISLRRLHLAWQRLCGWVLGEPGKMAQRECQIIFVWTML